MSFLTALNEHGLDPSTKFQAMKDIHQKKPMGVNLLPLALGENMAEADLNYQSAI